MANTKVEILGGQLDGSVLQNAASEATLQELVKAINGMTGRSGRGGSGGPGGGGGGGGLTGLNKASEELQKGFQSINKMFKGATNAMADFAGQAVAGNGSMSALSRNINDNLIKNIPLVGESLSKFGSIITFTIERMEEWNSQLQKANKVGASFNNSIFDIKMAATKSYTELEDFVQIVGENRHAMAMFGGTVTRGAKDFANMAEEMNKPGGFGQELRDMGWKTQDLNKHLAKYAFTTQAGNRNSKQVAELAAGYAMTLDKLSKLSGKSAQEQEEQMAKTKNDFAYQMALNKLDAKERDKVAKGLAEFTNRYGEIGADYYKSVVLGIPPLTEAQQIFASTMSEAAGAADRMVKSAKDKSVSADKFEQMSNDVMLDSLMGTIKQYGSIENIINAASSGMDGTAKSIYEAYKPIMEQLSKYGDVTKMSREEIQNAIEAAKKEQKDREAATLTMNRFDQMMENLHFQIKKVLIEGLMTAIETITPYVKAFGEWIVKASTNVNKFIDEALIPAIRGLPETMKNYWAYFTDGRAFKDIGDSLSFFFEELMIGIKNKLYLMSDAEAKKQKEELGLRKRLNDALRIETEAKVEQARIDEEDKARQGPGAAALPPTGAGAGRGFINPPMPGGGGSSSGPVGSAGGTGGKVEIRDAAGNLVETREGGHRNWRNNNPGNIEFGPFARSMGAIGSDGRFAIFPTMEMGRTAADTLLKGKNYANLSAAQAILKWAPPSENDTDSYIKGLSRRTGLDMSRRYSDMTPEEQRKFLDAMYQIEGGKVGRVTAAPEKRALGSLGATGRLFENFGGGKLMQLDNIESVQTPQQMAEVVKNVVKGTAGGLMGSGEGSQNGLADLLSTLNSNITALIKINKDALDVHRQHLTATRGMQGDLYKV